MAHQKHFTQVFFILMQKPKQCRIRKLLLLGKYFMNIIISKSAPKARAFICSTFFHFGWPFFRELKKMMKLISSQRREPISPSLTRIISVDSQKVIWEDHTWKGWLAYRKSNLNRFKIWIKRPKIDHRTTQGHCQLSKIGRSNNDREFSLL